MEEKEIQELLIRYAEGKCTEAEVALVESAYLLDNKSYTAELSKAQIDQDIKDVYAALPGPIGDVRLQPRKVALWPRIAISAAAVAAIVFGVWLFSSKYQDASIKTGSTASVNDVAPGKQGATLTLANGKKIRLTDASNGELAKQAGVVITKSANGQLVYSLSSRANAKDLDSPELGMTKVIGMTNTLSTAKGETYQVRLPDGSLVWLNAASSLTYSAALNERGVRRVRLEGEAYFEIAKDKKHPFVVHSGKQDVEVLGTHFNVSAYEDEGSVRTTLLEGSVKVSLGSRHPEFISGSRNSKGGGPNLRQGDVMLKPGEQATLKGSSIQVENVEADDAIAWKNGYFMFNNENLESIMTKIARWYNVDVEYKNPEVKAELFFGTISRYENVSKVLKLLERTDVVKFEVKGNSIKVKKK